MVGQDKAGHERRDTGEEGRRNKSRKKRSGKEEQELVRGQNWGLRRATSSTPAACVHRQAKSARSDLQQIGLTTYTCHRRLSNGQKQPPNSVFTRQAGRPLTFWETEKKLPENGIAVTGQMLTSALHLIQLPTVMTAVSLL